MYIPKQHHLQTGVLFGCVVSINVDPAKFDVSAGEALIVDWSDPVGNGGAKTTVLKFTAQTAITVPDLNGAFTQIQMVENPSVPGTGQLELTTNGIYNNLTRRLEVQLQIVLHNGTAIFQVSDDKQLAFEWAQTLRDTQNQIGVVSEGNRIQANGVNLNVNRSTGKATRMFFNAANDIQNPAVRDNVEAIEASFIYTRQEVGGGGGVFIPPFVIAVDPENYDVAGVITPVPNNKYTVQLFYDFGQSDTISVSYGQEVFGQIVQAEAALLTGSFFDTYVIPPNTLDGAEVTALIVKQGTTDLSDTALAKFVNKLDAITRNTAG